MWTSGGDRDDVGYVVMPHPVLLHTRSTLGFLNPLIYSSGPQVLLRQRGDCGVPVLGGHPFRDGLGRQTISDFLPGLFGTRLPEISQDTGKIPTDDTKES